MSVLELLFWLGNLGGICFVILLTISLFDQENIFQRIKDFFK